jgi:hypothetical protein
MLSIPVSDSGKKKKGVGLKISVPESDGIFSDHSLAGRCVSSHKDRLPTLQPQHRLLLKGVQLKRPLEGQLRHLPNRNEFITILKRLGKRGQPLFASITDTSPVHRSQLEELRRPASQPIE